MAVERSQRVVTRPPRGAPATAGAVRGGSILGVRRWRVRTKLAAVLVIPSLAFLAVAGLQTSASIEQTVELEKLGERVALGREIGALVHALQFERDRLSGQLAAVAQVPAADRERGRLLAALSTEQEAVRQARLAFDEAVAGMRDQRQIRAAFVELDALSLVRVGADEGWLSQPAVNDGYSRAIDALLALQAPPLAVQVTGGRGYQYLTEAKELASQMRGAIFAVVNAGRFRPGDAERLADIRAQHRAAQDRFRASATPAQLAHFDDVVRGQAVRASVRLEQSVLDRALPGRPGVDGIDVVPEQWWSATTTELELMREVERTLLADVVAATDAAVRDQRRHTILMTAGAGLILAVSLLLSARIGHGMVRSLRLLRREAMDVAHHQMPVLLERLRSSPREVPVGTEAPAMTVDGKDEIANVAEAFGQVHRSAVDLALEQAAMRRNLGEIFVNLARRSQVLVERQLELLDEMERDETEPAQLASLFSLDHLATRMRRNNESLLVLADADPMRRYDNPIALAAVALAASAEIEMYRRVRDEVAADVHVVGHAVGDLVHMLAELLDNATSFSPPDTTVTLTGHRLPAPAGALIQITDAGLGMSEEALAQANDLLAVPRSVDVAASERMGLVVVSRLAARHHIEVALSGASPGIRAQVRLPETLLAPPAPDSETFVPEARSRRSAVRAQDVLSDSRAEPAPLSIWWSRAGKQPATGPVPADPPPLPAVPATVTGGISAGGLPIRVPMAQLPPAVLECASEWGKSVADLDPDEVGGTLSRFYGGVRQAESEDAGAGQISVMTDERVVGEQNGNS